MANDVFISLLHIVLHLSPIKKNFILLFTEILKFEMLSYAAETVFLKHIN